MIIWKQNMNIMIVLMVPQPSAVYMGGLLYSNNNILALILVCRGVPPNLQLQQANLCYPVFFHLQGLS